jgi:hypothetical protein
MREVRVGSRDGNEDHFSPQIPSSLNGHLAGPSLSVMGQGWEWGGMCVECSLVPPTPYP